MRSSCGIGFHRVASIGVFVIRFIAAEIHRVRAEDDIEDVIAGVVCPGGSLIDDRGGMKTVDSEGCRSSSVDGALFRARDYERLGSDASGPAGPTADHWLRMGRGLQYKTFRGVKVSDSFGQTRQVDR
jgi:hypothetical protein